VTFVAAYLAMARDQPEQAAAASPAMS